jgi:glycosyltransferase involved in cell wall biosynthesis
VETIVFSEKGASLLHPDEPFVRRSWKNTIDSIPSLVTAVLAEKIECLLVQFHSGFYPPCVLAAIVDALSNRGVAVAVVFHVIPHLDYDLSVLVPALTKASLLVHRRSDADYLASLGLGNAEILPHGIYIPPGFTSDRAPSRTGEDTTFTVGAFGFLRPHKGFLELMAACQLVRGHIPSLQVKIFASLYPSEDSSKLMTRCHAYMAYLGNRCYTEFNSDFLEASLVTQKLQMCDVVVFPYQRTQESASGAVRMGLASCRPVLCTPLEIFDDVRDAVLFTDGFDAFAIAKGLLDLYRDLHLRQKTRRRQQQYLDEHNWENVAQLLLDKLPVQAGKPVMA